MELLLSDLNNSSSLLEVESMVSFTTIGVTLFWSLLSDDEIVSSFLRFTRRNIKNATKNSSKQAKVSTSKKTYGETGCVLVKPTPIVRAAPKNKEKLTKIKFLVVYKILVQLN